VNTNYEADAAQLPNDAVMPLALIANELLTNTVKYSGRDAGKIGVRLTKEHQLFLFYVEDEGPGFDLPSVKRRSSGLALTQGLARQLRRQFSVTKIPSPDVYCGSALNCNHQDVRAHLRRPCPMCSLTVIPATAGLRGNPDLS
jgi:hypothetical protein